MTLKFELIQEGEFDDYYYEIISDDDNYCDGIIVYDYDEWALDKIYYRRVLKSNDLIEISNKLDELNAATKEDKLFGFL